MPPVRQLGWHCRIRIKGNFWLPHPRHGWQRVSQFPLPLGSDQLIHNVEIHKHNSLTDVHLAIGWEQTSGEKWYILSTEPTTLQTLMHLARNNSSNILQEVGAIVLTFIDRNIRQTRNCWSLKY